MMYFDVKYLSVKPDELSRVSFCPRRQNHISKLGAILFTTFRNDQSNNTLMLKKESERDCI